MLRPMTYRVSLFAVLALAFLAPSSGAQNLTVKTYREMIASGGNDKAMADWYTSGAGMALMSANAELEGRHQKPLYCQPGTVVLHADNFESIIRHWISKMLELPPMPNGPTLKKLEALPASLALMRALIDAFPCPEKP